MIVVVESQLFIGIIREIAAIIVSIQSTGTLLIEAFGVFCLWTWSRVCCDERCGTTFDLREDIEKLEAKDKEHVFAMLDAFLAKNKLQAILA